jgi:hypothetical protein
MLTLADRRILDFERGWWMYPSPKECTIADVLGVDADIYYTRLRELVHLPEADRYDPLTVRRLRALIGSR